MFASLDKWFAVLMELMEFVVVVLLKSYFLPAKVLLFPEITQNILSYAKIVKISLY